MHLSAGPSEHSWHPVMTAKTNATGYWLNWRVLICAASVVSSMAIAAILIWKYEGPRRGIERAESEEEAVGTLYDDESWRPCLKEIHPAWLLAFRAIAFLVLSASLVVSVVVQGGQMFYFYTQWTFALVTIYFGIGSLLSMYGCYKFVSKVNDDRPGRMRLDAENGTYVAPTNGESANADNRMKRYGYQEEHDIRPVAGFWGYTFQIIYQTNAGAVMLTDCVFWLIIVPFLAIKEYNLNFFMIGMHSVNAIFLFGDTALNSLVPLVSHLIFLTMDRGICHLSMGRTYLYPNLVALPISRLVFTLCSNMVLLCGSDAYSLLCHLPPNNQNKAPAVFQIVSSVLPVP